ncbi:uncharacterized protein LOC100329017 [Saccoglossus kowalevskii]
MDIDAGSQQIYTFTLTATDRGDNQGSTLITIQVNPVNEHAPVFNPTVYHESIYENGVSGATVATLGVTDADTGDTMTITITSGDDAINKFAISGNDVITNGVLDYEALISDLYVLNIQAEDSGGKTSDAMVFIQIKGVNEYTPSFTDAPYDPFSVLENVAIETTVVPAPAVDDADRGTDGELVYQVISSSPPSGLDKFSVDVRDGAITTKASLNYEDQDTYTLRIKVSDTGIPVKTATTDIVINIVNVNDNPPTLDQTVYYATVLESDTAGTVLVNFVVTDPDDPDTAAFNFAIESSSDTSATPPPRTTRFTFDVPDKALTLTDPIHLDPDDSAQYDDTYTLIVEISDASQTATATVFVNVEPVNDYDPVFNAASVPASPTIAEAEPFGTSVFTLGAADGDFGSQGELTYSIIDGDTYNNFQIDSSTGEVSVKTPLDYELVTSVTLTLHVTDNDVDNPRTATSLVTVDVTDVVGDAQITCVDSRTIVLNLPEEDVETSDSIHLYDCSDPDGRTVQYLLSPAGGYGKFSLNSATGEVTVLAGIDWDVPDDTHYPLEITVKENPVVDADDIVILTLTVNILPTNEFNPVFLPAFTGAVDVYEDALVDSLVIGIGANTQDSDLSPHDIVEYRITSVTPSSGTNSFSLDPVTGELRLAKQLDREEEATYDIVIEIEDGGGVVETDTLTVTVLDINDNTPVCLQTAYSVQVLENTTPFTAVTDLDLTCTDPDDGTNGDLIYSVNQPNPATGPDFEHANGVGVRLLGGSTLDYDNTPNHQYNIELVVTDQGTPLPKSTTVYITVTILPENEFIPVAPVAGSCDSSIDEESAVGTLIVSCPVTDADSVDTADGQVVYSITAGDTDDLFYVDSSGNIRVANLIDYESLAGAPPSYTLTIQAENSAGPALTYDVVITIDDINDHVPACTSMSFVENVDEDETVPYVIIPFGTICSDDDTSDTLTYTIVPAMNPPFEVTATGDFKLNTAQDYDLGTRSYSMEISVKDTALHEILLDVIVNILPVNEPGNDPAFSPTTYSPAVDEDIPIYSTIVTVTANDGDSADTPHGVVHYSIAAACTCPQFGVNTNGDVILLQNLDYETDTGHTITVEATDSSGIPVAVTVTLTVNDVNDNPPIFSPTIYSVIVPEDLNNLPIETVIASDNDDPADNGLIQYVITGGNPDPTSIFTIDASTGAITNTVALDYDDISQQIFQINVEARDLNGGVGYRSATAMVTVHVEGRNTETPIFDSTPYTTSQQENIPVGQFVFQVSASDADLGPDGEIYFAMTGPTPFQIEEDTGIITLKSPLDRETTDTFELSVIATDRGITPSSNAATATVTITVTDYNDNEPVCTFSSVVETRAEDTAVGNVIYDLGAQCADTSDLGTNAIIEYSIANVDGDPSSNLFDIDSTTGEITLDALLGKNEYTPRFMTNPIIEVVLEDLPIGSTVLQLGAIDNDAGNDGELTYIILEGNSEEKFDIVSDTGVIYLLRQLDWETTDQYQLIVQASDGGTPPKTTTGTVDIYILDTNDNVPYCDPIGYNAVVPEDTSIDSYIITPNCMDDDFGSNFTYTIVSGNDDTRFRIDESSGNLYLNRMLDAETENVYVLTVKISDGLSEGTAVITVSVQGVNEYPPVYDPYSVYYANVAEDAGSGVLVTTVVTNDLDALDDGKVTYQITDGNINDVFQINEEDGSITVKRALDRETINEYTLEITATDLAAPGQELTALASVVVTINDRNDQPPLFQPVFYTGTILEDAAIAELVATMTVVDYDLGSPNTDYKISIKSGDVLKKFDISGDELVVNGVLDYETTKSYFITIEVEDLGTPALTSTGHIAVTVLPVNEAVPEFQFIGTAKLYESGIDENAVGYTSVLTVNAVELDPTDDPDHVHSQIRYYITGGNDDGIFTIDTRSGVISTAGIIDREEKDFYTLEVTAVDSIPEFGDELIDTAVVNITVRDVNDNAPLFDPTLYSISVYETADIASTLMSLFATDADIGTNKDIDYDIVYGNTGSDFDFISNELLTVHTLAWHRTQFYRLVIRAKDRGTPSKSGYARVTIEVKPINNQSPIFPADTDTVSLPEDTLVGTPIYTAVASDADYGFHGEVEYYITDGLDGDDGTFHVNRQTGLVTLGANLDREYQDQYIINITAFDKAENETLVKRDSFLLTIDITDVNDNDPICVVPIDLIYMEENQDPDIVITTVRATDADIDENAELSYTVISGVNEFDFELQAGTHDIYAIENLDREKHDIYSLNIKVSDNGVPPRTALCAIEIHLIDQNDNDPLITPNNVKLSIYENSPQHTSLFTFEATDPDEDLNGEVFFTIIGGDDHGHFSIGEISGELETTAVLDREEISSYALQIRASDKGDPARMGNALVNITVIDENDNGPICKKSQSYTKTVREDMAIGMPAMVIRSYDKDEYKYKNTERTYRIMSGNDGTWAIDPEKGSIYLLGELNRQTAPGYSFVVRIEDDKDPTMYDECTASINVIEARDGISVVDADVVLTVQENVDLGTIIGNVGCFDADICGGDMMYDIIGGANMEDFYLNIDTGTLLVAGEIDYEEVQQYALLVRSIQNGYEEAYGVVAINVIDMNDHAPIFLTTSPYASGVREDSPLQSTVIHVSATDEDAGEDSIVTYSLSTALDDNGPIANTYFSINSDSGVITIKDELDSELYREISLVVLATDSGSPAETASATVTITIVDVNDNPPVFNPDFYSGEMSYTNLLGEPVINLFATDADQDSIVQYSIQDSSGAFTVNPGSGAVSLSTGVRPTVYTKYPFTVTGTDTGNPPQTSEVINARIDTFDPYMNLVAIHVTGRTKQDILDDEENFLESLNTLIRAEYPTGRCGISHVLTVGDVVTVSAKRRLLQSSSVIVYVYGVADDTADVESGLANTKNFISQEYLYSTFAGDDLGTPSSALTDVSDYPMTLVEKVTEPTDSWWTSAAGIATIVMCSLLGLVALAAICTLIYCCCCGALAGACAGDGKGCCVGCWRRFVQAVKDCCRSKPRPPPPEEPKGPRHNWGAHVYEGYHRDEIPIKKKGKAEESVLSLPQTKSSDAAGRFKSLAGKARGGGVDDDIAKIKEQHEADKRQFNKVQGVNKARAEQDLQDKLAERRNRRFGNTDDECVLTYPGTSYSINENTAKDTIVVQGSSFTGGVYPAYEARIVSVSPGPVDLFYVKPDTGELYIGSEPLDYEESPMHTVIIECWDTTDPATKDSVTVTVNVVNANDPPEFTNLPGTGSVNEDAGSSASVFQVNVQDQDTSNTITYAIINQNPGGTLKFTIDSSGLVKVISANSLQADPPSAVTLYTLLIRASDGSTFISDVLTINVLGTFDESPSFARSSYTGSVDEDGTAISWINPPSIEPKDDLSDADGAGDSYTYSISGAGASKFRVGESTGIITASDDMDIDAGSQQTYTFSLTATDRGDNQGSTLITIQVNPVNEHAPVFNPTVYHKSIYENGVSGATVATLGVTDADTGDTMTIIITSGDDVINKFDISGNDVITNGVLDYEALVNDLYILNVRAEDSGGKTSDAMVFIQVKGVNEYTPSFSDAPYDPFSVLEDVAIETTVVPAPVVDDADRGPDGELIYNIVSINPPSGLDKFSVDVRDGAITTKASLNYEDQDTYTLRIKVSDTGIPVKTATTDIVINVVNVNDNPPTLDQTVYYATVLESDTAGTVLVNFVVSDPDDPGNAAFDFMIDPASDNSAVAPLTTRFTFDVPDKALTLTDPIHLDPGDVAQYDDAYILLVEISDGSQTATATVYVNVEPVNDYDPVFATDTDPPGPISINEGEPFGTPVFKLEATDGDFGYQGELTYSIIDGDTYNNFLIDSSTGEVSVKTPLVYELGDSVTLTLHVSDNDVDNPRTATAIVTVGVNDVTGDGQITCVDSMTIVVNLPEEDVETNDLIHDYDCSDPDGTTVIYTLNPADGFGKFEIDAASGEVTVKAGIDWDNADDTHYPLEITVKENPVVDANDVVILTLTVNILPTNEFNPVFLPAFTGAVDVSEDELVDYLVIDIGANTQDNDLSPHDIVEYRISSVTPSSGTNSFSLDPVTGELRLTKQLDREEEASYDIVIEIEDGGGVVETDTLTVTVLDINDNTPVCLQTAYSVQVLENTTPFTAVTDLDLTCTDPDDGTNGDLIYSVNQPNPATGPDFEYAPAVGVRLLGGSTLDYDNTPNHQYNVELVVTDQGTPLPKSTTVYITVTILPENEFAPVSPAPGSCDSSIDEESSIGSVVVSCPATDADSVDTADGLMVYSITDGDTDDLFYIDGSGTIRVANPIDYESLTGNPPSYTLTITAVNSATTLSYNAVITINDVNDHFPACTSMSFVVNVNEDEGVPYTIIELSSICNDEDPSDVTLFYSIDPSMNPPFEVTATGDFKLNTAQDYDLGTRSYNLDIHVSDTINEIILAVTVNILPVNDNNPLFNQPTYTTDVDEDIPIYSTIVTVTANDGDSADTPHGVVHYSIAAACACPQFGINTNGDVILLQNLDYETDTGHTITVEATDSSGTTVPVTVTLNVNDVNDNPPIFSPTIYSVIVPEDMNNLPIETVIASDNDDPVDNGLIQYVITGGNPDPTSIFTIDPSTGAITNTVALDYDDVSQQIFQINVEARDLNGGVGYRSATAMVTVHVEGRNTETPIFDDTPYTTSQQENIPVGQFVFQVSASDADFGPDGEIYFALTGSTSFQIEEDTGIITLKSPLDRETIDTCKLSVIATDRGTTPSSNAATATVTITVTDYNDNEPVCTFSSVVETRAEDTAVGNVIYDLGAQCADTSDLGANAIIEYSIANVDGDPSSNLFDVDLSTGEITLGATLENHAIQIHVSDVGPPSLTTIVMVNVLVTGINEYTPTFTPGGAQFISIPEDTSLNTVVFDADAADSDNGESLVYSLTGSTKFDINPTNGEIYLVSSIIPTDVFTLTITATDDGAVPGTDSSTQSLTITVDEVNNNPPSFDSLNYFGSVFENDDGTSPVVTMAVTDVDGDNVGLSIISGNTGSVFSVDQSGNIYVIDSTNLDAETSAIYTLTIRATDDGTPSRASDTTVNILVKGVNEHAPVFPLPSYSESVYETDLAGTLVLQVIASDSDGGVDGDITYSIVSGDEGKFGIDASSGEIVVLGALDCEIKATYNLVVNAVDNGATSLTGATTVTITVICVNDEGPSCNPDFYSWTISENTVVSTTVGSIVCNDDGGSFMYTIVNGNSPPTFAIPVDNVPEIVLKYEVDFETVESFQLIVKVIDDATPPGSSTVTVVVDITGENEYTPRFLTNPIVATLSEDLSIGATAVQLNATDYDSGNDGDITYSIIDGNEEGKFDIVSDTGVIYLLRKLDWEMTETYQLLVEAVDGGMTEKTGTGTINVVVLDTNDNVPYCDPIGYNVVVPEDTSIDSYVITPNCMDDDFGSDFVYTITSGNGDNYFRIDENSGSIYVNRMLDAETKTVHVLTMKISDGVNEGSAVITVAVQGVNEYPPVYEPYSVYHCNVLENSAAGTLVITVTAVDRDVMDDGKVYYEITDGNIDGVFEINDTEGSILVKRTLDRETIDKYTLEITATDLAIPGMELQALASVVITVDDANDQPPTFQPVFYAGTILEDAIIGALVTTMTVVDNDLGSPNTDFTISIVSGDDSNQFSISGDELVVNGVLDYETTKSYYLTIEVADLGIPVLSSTGYIAVTVLPVNEAVPEFQFNTGTFYEKDIDENVAGHTSVITVNALEPDPKDDPDHVHSQIRYYITGGNEDGKFSIDTRSGVIYTAGIIDREETDFYTLEVTAIDSIPEFGDELHDTALVKITVNDVNDNAPAFEPTLYSIEVYETAAIDSTLMTLFATDNDLGTNQNIDYDILFGNTGGDFDFIDNELRTKNALAWHRTAFYRLVIRAVDGGDPSLSGYARITVEVKSVNNHAPKFTADTDTISLPENTLVGAPIYTAAASDDDYGFHGEIEYYITDGTQGDDGTFHINSQTGLVTLGSNLDREYRDLYILNITAFDKANNETMVKRDSFILNIEVTDINDNDPICDVPIDIIFIEENQGPDVLITTVHATDPDINENAELSYTVISGVNEYDFVLDEVTHGIRAIESLDRERHDIYSINIKVSDNGFPQRTALCAIEIHVIDKNDNDPLITPSDVQLSVYENSPKHTSLFTFVATDPDEDLNGETFFTIIGGDDNGHFGIGEYSGRLETIAVLDREEISSYVLLIRVSDKGDPARTGDAVVNVTVIDENDNGPICTDANNYLTNVREDMEAGMPAMVIRSSDPDDYVLRNTERTYRIMSGNDGTWAIDAEKGSIYLLGELNRQQTIAYSFVIRIEDDKNPNMYDECTASITVLEAAEGVPLVDADVELTVQENAAIGTVVGTLNCFTICGGDIMYDIIGGSYMEDFYLSIDTGILLVAGEIDYEEIQQYAFLVRTIQDGYAEDYGVVAINVIDMNDHAPTFINTSPYASGIREDSPLQTTVIHVSATDEDAGEDSIITYSISSVLDDNGPIANTYFSINSDTGVVTVKEELDSELYREITFVVIATDSGSPAETASTTVTITIVDVNDNPPVFNPHFYSGELSYLNLLGEPVIQVQATDADLDTVVQYSIHDSSSTFSVNPGTGDVSLSTGVRPAVYTKYAFTVTGTDDGNPPLISEVINARIDTFNPYLNLVAIHLTGRTKQDILDDEENFLEPLTTLIRADYPTGRCGISHVLTVGDVVTVSAKRRLLQSSNIIVYVYGVADNTADVESGLSNTKNFISQQYLFAVFSGNDEGTPSSALSGLSDYPMNFIENVTEPIDDWWFSAAGIATIAICSLLGLAALIGLSALIYSCCCGSLVGCRTALCAGLGDGRGCCAACWRRFILAIKSCCRNCCESKPRPPPPEPEASPKRNWGANVYKGYHREEIPIKKKGLAEESVLSLPSPKSGDAAVKFKGLAGKARGGAVDDDIAKIKEQHEADKRQFNKVQGVNKARAEQDLQDKLAERRNRRFGNNGDGGD